MSDERPEITIWIPLSVNKESKVVFANLEIPATMSDKEWASLIRVINAMRPGLVSHDKGQH